MKFFLLFISLLFSSLIVRASHIMGGEITWKCQAGQYVFTLTIYRDCNQADASISPQTLRFWNHPSVQSITVNYVSRQDISPTCTAVAGSSTPITCGSGNNAGNGLGAIEKIIYQSDPISIPGTPPTMGWAVTYDHSPRNPGITNLVSAVSHGITIVGYIYQSKNGQCVFNSPQFTEIPNTIVCKGQPYSFNANAYSLDGDSISYNLSAPLDNISNNTFNPPTTPVELQYISGFSPLSPTPKNTQNPLNQNFTIDPQTGQIAFLSYNTGNFVYKVLVSNYQNGKKISTVQQEFQIIVTDCGQTSNQPPVISLTPTNNVIDVTVGNTVNFDFNVTDNDLLQDGSLQTVTLNASGDMFGTNLTSTTGCNQPPCATLDQTLPITFNGTKNIHFDWQTDCNHLLSNGIMQEEKSYLFVLSAKDNICQIPAKSYKTVRVNIHNVPNSIPKITCIQGQSDGSYILTIESAANINLPYYVRDENDNNLATINSLSQTSVTIPSGSYNSFHLYFSPTCLGAGTYVSTNSVDIIELSLNNPLNGTVFLQWTAPSTDMSSYGSQYHIYQEYPAGTWTQIGSVPNNVNSFRDTISICKAFINYRVGIDNGSCELLSNVKGDTLQDLIAPFMPVITSVSIDTTTGNPVISWHPSSQNDTYGYIVYKTDNLGILVEVDTLYGINDTSFMHDIGSPSGPVTYSVAAFDHCFTKTLPKTFQTSAKANPNTSIYLTQTFDACSKISKLTWSSYLGWSGNISYKVLMKKDNGWININTLNGNTTSVSLADIDSCSFLIVGVSTSGNQSFSNILVVHKTFTNPPAFHYTKVATVDGKYIKLKHYMKVPNYPSELVIQRKNGNQFDEIGRLPITQEESEYIDSIDVDVNSSSYTYRVLYTDSCGFTVNPANEVTTILNQISRVDENNMTVDIHWTPYSKFEGGVSRYEIFRAINGQYSWPAIYVAASNEFNFEDHLDNLQQIDGKVCYRVIAKEGANIYNFNEESFSNEACYVFEPLIYIPNAFTPGGKNPIFNPVINLAQINHYSMTIFNRWNNVIYKTDDVHKGWDGIMNNGEKAPFDVYGYVISIEDGNGKEIRRTGHVTIIWSN